MLSRRCSPGRPWATRLAGVVAALLLALPAASALAASGGAGLGGGAGQPQPATKSPTRAHSRPRRATRKPRHVTRRPRHATATSANPFGGRGMWIWYVSASSGGDLSSLVATAKARGVTTLMIKAGDGSSPWSQFNRSLVSTLHAHGLRVCAWQYVYGAYPAAEAQVGAQAVAAGADCLIIDAETEYEGKYVAAQAYLTQLRSLIGAAFPVALAGFPYVDYHPAFPYSVFLGPGGAQYNLPQMYWVDIGTTVDAVYAHTFSYNALFGRPITPLGQVYNNPSAADIVRFRRLSRAYGTSGVSWWDWQEAGPVQWRALAQPTTWLTGFTSPAVSPTLGSRSTGDLVVWAQEHLLTAGYALSVTGRYDAATIAAVTAFQQAHALTADGLTGPQTWQALLRYPPAKVIWTSTGATSPTGSSTPTASTAHVRAALATEGLRQPVPASARLKARRNEIPAGLGAG